MQEIKKIIHSPSFDRREALLLHREMLLEKRRRLDRMLATIDKTLRHMKGEVDMTNEEKFAGFDFRENPMRRKPDGGGAMRPSMRPMPGSPDGKRPLPRRWEIFSNA